MDVLVLGTPSYVLELAKKNEKAGLPHMITVLGASTDKSEKERFDNSTIKGLTYRAESLYSSCAEEVTKSDVVICALNPENKNSDEKNFLISELIRIIKKENKKRRKDAKKAPITLVYMSSLYARDIKSNPNSLTAKWHSSNEKALKESYADHYSTEEVNEMLLEWEKGFPSIGDLDKIICTGIKEKAPFDGVAANLKKTFLDAIKEYYESTFNRFKELYGDTLIANDYSPLESEREKLKSLMPIRPNEEKDYVIVQLSFLTDSQSSMERLNHNAPIEIITSQLAGEALFELIPVANRIKGNTFELGGGTNCRTSFGNLLRMKRTKKAPTVTNIWDGSIGFANDQLRTILELPEGSLTSYCESLKRQSGRLRLLLQKINYPWNNSKQKNFELQK